MWAVISFEREILTLTDAQAGGAAKIVARRRWTAPNRVEDGVELPWAGTVVRHPRYMSAKSARQFLGRADRRDPEEGTLFSLHMKATD